MLRSQPLIKEQPKTPSPVRGYSPTLPVIIIPGIISSPLKIEESAAEPRWRGHRIWVPSTKKLMEVKMKKDNSSETGNSAQQIDENTDLHMQILRHLVMKAPNEESTGILVRPLFKSGVAGLNLMDANEAVPHGFTYGNPYSGLINMLKNTYGYAEEKDFDSHVYDWRCPPSVLEARDGCFTHLKQKIEKMNAESKDHRGVVLFAHCMGNCLVRYFLNWVLETTWGGRDWLDENVHSWVMIGSPNLGVSWVGRAIVTGACPYTGMDTLFSTNDLLVLFRSLSSLPWMFPSGDARQNLFFLRREGALEIRRPYVKLADNSNWGVKKKVTLTFSVTWVEREDMEPDMTEVTTHPSTSFDGVEAVWETQDVVVTGAGQPQVNGIYRKSLETRGGRPVYHNLFDSNYKIQWCTMSHQWMIDFSPGAAPYCLKDNSALNLPLDVEWSIYQGGTDPPPVVTAKEDCALWMGGPEKLPGGAKLRVSLEEAQTTGRVTCCPSLSSCLPCFRGSRVPVNADRGSSNKTKSRSRRVTSDTNLFTILNHSVADADGWRTVTLYLPKSTPFGSMLCAMGVSSGKVSFQMRWRDAVDLRADMLEVPRSQASYLGFMFGESERKERWSPSHNEPCPIRHADRTDVRYDKVIMEDMLKMLECRGLINVWRDYYQNDRHWLGTAMDQAPPINKVVAIHGTNVRTEIATVYRLNTAVEPRKASFRHRFVPDCRADLIPERKFLLSQSNLSIEEGIVYEEPPQEEEHEEAGDGMVPGRSLRHSRKWRYDLEKNGGSYEELRLSRSPHTMNLFDPTFFTQVNDMLTEKFIL